MRAATLPRSGAPSASLPEPDGRRSRSDVAELRDAENAEELKERLERELNEHLQELRSLVPGAEVLFGLLLAIGFTAEFGELDSLDRYV